MLDRGEQKDWFESREIVAEAVVAGLGLWIFLAHSLTAARPFVNLQLFRDRNFVTGTLVTFVTFIVYIGTMSLMAPMLQQLYGYPVMAASWMMLPRSAGMLVTMLVLGRVVHRLDPRLMLGTGLAVLGFASWSMSGFTLNMGGWPVIWTAIIQGIGVASITLPANVIAFGTLRPELRPEATSFMALIRNMGQSIGVSVMTVMLSINTQTVHSTIAAHFPTTLDYAHIPYFGQFFFDQRRLAEAINSSVTRQATMVAYIDDFYLLAWLCLITIPFIMLVRVTRAGGPAPAPAAAASAAADAH
jgi:DHA2 family multidrug resistance protein